MLALPGPLLSALRAAELDDPGVLCEYPSLSKEELYAWLGEKLGEDAYAMNSGATPSGSTALLLRSWNSSTAIPMISTWCPVRKFVRPANCPGWSSVGFSGVCDGRRPKNRPCIRNGREGRRPEDRPSFLQCANGRYLFSLSAGGDLQPKLLLFLLLLSWIL